MKKPVERVASEDTAFESLLDSGLEDLLIILGNERQVRIFAARYGLYDGKSYTLEQIGQKHNVTRERIRQILIQCQRRIRFALHTARRQEVNRPLVALTDALTQATFAEDKWDIQKTAELVVRWWGHLSYYAGAQLLIIFLPLGKEALPPLHRAIQRQLKVEQAIKWKAWQSQRRLESFLKDVRFPGGSRAYTATELGPLFSARTPRETEGFYSVKLNRHVGYDSKLEWRVLQWLEGLPEVRAYQEQPLAIPYHHLGKSRLYYPDILVHLISGQVVLIEVKPVRFMAASVNLSKWIAMKALCAEMRYGLLILDGRYTLLEVMRRARDTERLAQRLQSLIQEHGLLTYPVFRQHFGLPLPTVTDFTAAVIQHRIPFQVYPFRLGESQVSADSLEADQLPKTTI